MDDFWNVKSFRSNLSVPSFGFIVLLCLYVILFIYVLKLRRTIMLLLAMPTKTVHGDVIKNESIVLHQLKLLEDLSPKVDGLTREEKSTSAITIAILTLLCLIVMMTMLFTASWVYERIKEYRRAVRESPQNPKTAQFLSNRLETEEPSFPNYFKHYFAGQVLLDALDLKLRLFQDHLYALFAITDTGHGIATESSEVTIRTFLRNNQLSGRTGNFEPTFCIIHILAFPIVLSVKKAIIPYSINARFIPSSDTSTTGTVTLTTPIIINFIDDNTPVVIPTELNVSILNAPWRIPKILNMDLLAIISPCPKGRGLYPLLLVNATN